MKFSTYFYRCSVNFIHNVHPSFTSVTSTGSLRTYISERCDEVFTCHSDSRWIATHDLFILFIL